MDLIVLVTLKKLLLHFVKCHRMEKLQECLRLHL